VTSARPRFLTPWRDQPERLSGVGDDGRVLSDTELRAVAERVTGVPGVVGVVLGGSRARGEHRPDSDVDLGLYYRHPLDVRALRVVAVDIAGPAAEVTEPGAWGPWVDGGGWLRIDGTPVDWLYRDLDRVRLAWQDARDGRFAFHAQVGHPLGVPDFAYAGELALGVVLTDPSGELAALQADLATYPPALGESLVRTGLWEARFCLDIADKAVPRGDTSYVAGCLFRAIELCAHALHGHARRWLINEKGAVDAAARLPAAPPGFSRRAHGVLARLGDRPEQLGAALASASELVEDVRAACRLSPSEP
jgi:predicted nucleotidyltransferase